MSKQLEIDNSENINFEEAIKRLEKIATELEDGKNNLEDSIKMFEEGMKLSNKCSQFLEDAEKKITVLINENGNIKEENFVAKEEQS